MRTGLDTARFTRLRRLGEGGFGVVHEALDRVTGARVALKTLTRLDGGALYRFKQEFRTLAEVAHENLVRLGELRCEDDEWFFTMELIDGVSWLTYVRCSEEGDIPSPAWLAAPPRAHRGRGGPRSGTRVTEAAAPAAIRASRPDDVTLDEAASPRAAPEPIDARAASETLSTSIGDDPSVSVTIDFAGVDLRRVRETLVQIACGLETLHRAGIVHRDLKPQNVLVTREGRAVILDFGIAARRDEVGRTDEAIVGTPSYMAPEQALGRDVAPAADWYSLGVMLFQAIAGTLPYKGDFLDVLAEKQHRPAPRLSEIHTGVPADLDALCASLLAIDPAARPTGAEVLERLGAEASLPPVPSRRGPRSDRDSMRAFSAFVGRGEAMDQLFNAFDLVHEGRPATVLVHGTSGIGKSALVRAFADRAEGTAEALVLIGRCYERESVPYKAFDSVVDALSRYLLRLPPAEAKALLPPQTGALVRLFPVLGRVPAVADMPRRREDRSEGRSARGWAFAALRELFTRLGARCPLVLVIDDAQWGDADSASLLGELTLPPDPPALLLLLAYRSEDADKSPLIQAITASHRSAPQDRPTFDIPLAPLSPREARDLAHMLCAEGAASPAALAIESAGHPFFLSQLARAANATRGQPKPAILRVDELVRANADALPPAARALLRVICVAGKPIRRRTAIEAAGLQDDEAEHAAAVLRVGHFTRTATRKSDEHVEPYHDRIRESVTASLPDDVLRETHAALASALEKTDESDFESLFLHHRAAGHTADAARLARLAADKAAEALAFDRAAQFYREALALEPRGDGHDLSLQLAEALANAGRGAEAAKCYLAVAEATSRAISGGSNALSIALQDVQLHAYRKAAEQLLFAGHITAGREAMQHVLTRVRLRLAKSPLDALIRLLALRCWITLRGIRHRARTAAEVPPALLAKVDICWSVACGIGTVDTIEGFRFVTHNLLLSLSAGEPRRLCRALVLEASFAASEGGAALRRARRLVAKAASLAAETQDPESVALVRAAHGVMAYMGGSWQEAKTHLLAALDMYRELAIVSRFDRNFASMLLAYACARLGDIHHLDRHMPDALNDASERGDLFLGTNLRLAEGNLWWLFRDDPAAAKRVAEEAVGAWSHERFHLQHWYEMQARCEIDLYEGRADEALSRVTRVLPQMKKAMLLRVEMIGALVTELRARAELAAWKPGDREGLRRVTRAANALRRHPLPWCAPEGWALAAGVAKRSGDSAAATAALEQAISGFEATHMALHEAAARARLAAWQGDGPAEKEALSAVQARGAVRPSRLVSLWFPDTSNGSTPHDKAAS